MKSLYKVGEIAVYLSLSKNHNYKERRLINRFIGLVLVVLLSFSTLISVCPTDDGSIFNVHFVLENCEAHDCSRNQHEHHDEDERQCCHSFCDDISFADDNILPPQKNTLSPATIVSPAKHPVIALSFPVSGKSVLPDIPLARSFQRSSILRI